MPKVRITQTVPIAEDGIHIRKYASGWEGEVSEAAARILISIGAAQIVRTRLAPSEQPEVAPSGTTVIEGAPEKKEAVKSTVPAVIRVWQLSDEIGVSSKRIIEIAVTLGIEATVPMSGLTTENVNKIKAELEKPKR